MKVLTITSVGLLLIVFTMVTAYVFAFGKPRSGIHFDYVVFTLFMLLLLWRIQAI